MRRFDQPVYGPGALRKRGSRRLLAVPGVEYSDAEAAAIQAEAALLTPVAPASEDVGLDLQADELGIINRGNGWYELPNGSRARGRAKAEAEVAEMAAADPLDGITVSVDGREVVGVLDEAKGTGELLPAIPELEALGGDWWLLPDGERVRGREDAEQALAVWIGDHPRTAGGDES